MQKLQKLEKYAPVVVRIGMSLVIIWFGSQQLMDASKWVSFLPDWIGMLPLSQVTFVQLNGWFEIVFGLLMFVGLYTRIAGLLLGIHLLGIAQSIGYSALGIRDLGLAIATLSVFLKGPDVLSLDTYFSRKNNGNIK